MLSKGFFFYVGDSNKNILGLKTVYLPFPPFVLRVFAFRSNSKRKLIQQEYVTLL